MNKLKRLCVLLAILWIVMTVITACDYDAAQPLWYQDKTNPAVPSISQLVPDKAAPAGVNAITILGDHFSDAIKKNEVYFNNVSVEILSASTTSLTVRRPNLVSDNAIVKVVSTEALLVAKYSPYKIEPVHELYGGFVENLALAAVAVDADENVYVLENLSRKLFKVTPTEVKTELGIITKTISDATIAPGGKIVLFVNNNAILQVDPTTGLEETYVSLKKRSTCGDFDKYGCLYAGSKNTDLFVIKPDLTNAANGGYATLDILVIKAYQDYLYVVTKNTKPDANNPAVAIWRHEIQDANGTLGERKLFLDWAATGSYAASTINDIAFSENGTMYFATDNADPVFILNTNLTQDVLYKAILPATAEKLVWGRSTYAYMIAGGTNWTVIRIDMGSLGGF